MFQEICRCFGADADDAGDIVGGIADQRQIIDNLSGGDVEFLLDFGGAAAFERRSGTVGHQQFDTLGDDLRHIFVGRNNPDFGV